MNWLCVAISVLSLVGGWVLLAYSLYVFIAPMTGIYTSLEMPIFMAFGALSGSFALVIVATFCASGVGLLTNHRIREIYKYAMIAVVVPFAACLIFIGVVKRLSL